MLDVECDDVRGTSGDGHFQYHVILRIRKNPTPSVVDRLLSRKLCDPVDDVVNCRCWDENPAFRAVADIIVFREQRNGQSNLKFPQISSQ